MTARRPVLLLVLSAALLSACGGESDEDAIRSIVEEGSRNPASICANLTDQGLEDLGGKAECEQLAASGDNADPDAEVESIEVDGEKATAKLSGGKEESGATIRFVKEGGEWRVSPD